MSKQYIEDIIRQAEELIEKHEDETERLLAILENILKNGEFIP